MLFYTWLPHGNLHFPLSKQTEISCTFLGNTNAVTLIETSHLYYHSTSVYSCCIRFCLSSDPDIKSEPGIKTEPGVTDTQPDVKMEEAEVKLEGTPLSTRLTSSSQVAAGTPTDGPQPMQGIQHTTPLTTASAAAAALAATSSYNITPPQSTLLHQAGSTSLLPSLSGAEIESLRSVLPKGFHHNQLLTPGSVPSMEDRGRGSVNGQMAGAVVVPEKVLELVTGHVEFLETCGRCRLVNEQHRLSDRILTVRDDNCMLTPDTQYTTIFQASAPRTANLAWLTRKRWNVLVCNSSS